MMKGRSTLTLLACIAVLGIFIFFQELWRAKVPSKELQQRILFDLDFDTLLSLEFEHTNVMVQCIKENGVWMTGGADLGLGRADIAHVQRLVVNLNSMGKGTTITAKHREMRGLDQSEYGFTPPSIRITAEDHRGKHAWLVGRKSPLGNMLYVKTGDQDDIFTITDDLLKFIPMKVDQLRDHVLFPVDVPGISRLEIRGAGGFVQLLKDSKNGWQIQQPIVALGDSAKIAAYMKRLHGLRVEEFLADNVSDFAVYGLQGETRQISMGGADDTSKMVIVGDEIPDRPTCVYARRADDTSVFALKKEVIDMLSFDIDDFRDRRALLTGAKDISSISIKHGSEILELVLDKEGQWMIQKPVSWVADHHTIATLLQMWEDTVVFDFNDKGSDEEAEWIFEFGSSSLSQTNTIQVLPTQGRIDGIRVRRDQDSTIYQLNLQKIGDEADNPLSYKDRLVWNLDAAAVQKVSFTRSDTDHHSIEKQDDGSYLPMGINGNFQVDAPAFEQVLAGLKIVSASEYVTYNPRDLSSYGLDQPELSIHISLSGTNQLGRVLMIGDKTDDGHYAMVQGRDVVFLLEGSVIDNLSRNIFVAPTAITPDS
jgi:hypothetical protein